MEQFQPDGFSGIAAIDSLAMDYIYLARASQIVEQLHRPQGISPEDDAKWRNIENQRRDTKLLDRMVKQARRNDWPVCTREEAERIAPRIAEFVSSVQSDLAKANMDEEAENQPPVLPPEFERFRREQAKAAAKIPDNFFKQSPADIELEEADEREFQELAKLIGPAAQRLRDLTYVTGVLSGERKPRSGDQMRLCRLSDRIRSVLKQRESEQQDFQRKIENLRVAAQIAIAQAPQQLIILHRYLSRIERNIERKLRHLERR